MKSNVGRLVKINLLQRFNLNEARYSKDPAKKRRLIMVASCMVLTLLVLLGYVSGMAWVFCYIGAAACVPAYMLTVTSVVILFVTIFKAGSIIFQMQTYEMLIALPISVREIVISRFLTMYLEDLLLSAVTMLPGCIIYAFFEPTGIAFWLMTFVGILVIPMFPLVIAAILGVLITAAGARVRHKNLIMLVLSMLLVIGVLVVAYVPVLMNPEAVVDISQIGSLGTMLVEKINGGYFMAGLYTTALLDGNWMAFAGFLLVSLVVFVLFVVLTERKFVAICSALTARSTKGNYKIGEMQQQTARKALYRKEMKRYFSSNTYVMNTAVGYVMAILLALVIAVMGVEKLEEMIQIPGILGRLVPFALAWTVAMASITACSISLEGKNWWIPMSLPITAKELVQSKIMVSLSLALPVCAVSGILTGIRFLKSPQTALMLFVVPVVYSVLTAVFGIVVNEHFPMMKWDNEVTVIKQSASTMISILFSFVAAGVPMAVIQILPKETVAAAEWCIIAVLLVISFLLYQCAIRFDFLKIEE